MENIEIKPCELEPMKENRFLVKFPEWIGIESNQIIGVNFPCLYNGKWSDIEVMMINYMDGCTAPLFDIAKVVQSENKIVKFLKKINNLFFEPETLFEFTIEALDPTGVVVESWVVSVEGIEIIDFGGYMRYSSSDLMNSAIRFKVKDCELVN